jgi:raffinose/stachyose/melibiose transport system permease protein
VRFWLFDFGGDTTLSTETSSPVPGIRTEINFQSRRRVMPLSELIGSLVLIAFAAVVVAPLLYMVLTSFKTTQEIFGAPLALPASFSFKNFIDAWNLAHFADYFKNSLVVTVSAVGLTVLCAAMASYVLGRHQFRGSSAIYLFFVLGLVMPIRLAIVPILVILKSVGLGESLVGLVVVYVASSMPFSIFLLTTYVRTIPVDLDDAARVDGASEWGIFRRVMLPLSRPGLAVVAIYATIQVWNDYFLPLTMIHKPELSTLPLGVALFFASQYWVRWDLIFASLTISAIPCILAFLVLSRPFVRGITDGAIK